ncbi:rod shape-determining protein MreC [Candidatus Uhrbacteria bacterium]|nr:rod shape-determining protein MreC [Candidatus Uhrbacteria bacterium]
MKKGETQLPILIVGVISIVLLLYLFGILSPIADGVRALFLPVQRANAFVMSALGFHGTGHNVVELEKRAKDLEARVSTLSVDYVKIRSLEEENRHLRETAKFLQNSTYDHVGARVISRSTDLRDSYLVIDRGSNDGLEIGMAVVVDDGVFIGKITQLYSRISRVTLVSDEQSRVAATKAGETKLLGVVEGRGTQLAQMTLIPQNEPLNPNDLIVTAGIEEKIPPNLVIGIINRVDSKPTDPFKIATLEPLSLRDRIDLVIVLRPAVLRPEPGL